VEAKKMVPLEARMKATQVEAMGLRCSQPRS
jgi:hypothetical protein